MQLNFHRLFNANADRSNSSSNFVLGDRRTHQPEAFRDGRWHYEFGVIGFEAGY